MAQLGAASISSGVITGHPSSLSSVCNGSGGGGARSRSRASVDGRRAVCDRTVSQARRSCEVGVTLLGDRGGDEVHDT